MSHQTVIVLDFGGQYNQLIARRVRECGVYCEVKPYTTPLADIRAMNPIGIIFTGGPNSVYDPKSPQVDPAIFTWGVPILGICYGCQLMAHNLGGRVTEAQDDSAREYGKTETYFDSACKLFKGLPAQGITWMSHGDYMEKVPEGFALVAHSDACPNVAICDESRGFYGVQYHPEVNHTEHGTDMIRNFLYEVCGAAGDWTMGDYKETAIRQIREKVGDGKVLLALSGGVDSSVAAALVAEAVGSQLTCVFVDHGLMRLNEGDEVEAVVLTLDRDERKMSLGLKQLTPDPWADIETKYAVGSRHTAKVRNFTNFGVFVEIEEGIDGLIHISDLSWTKKVKHPSEFTQIGADIEVVVLEIDKDNRRLSLGHKQLEENPWNAFEQQFAVDSIHTGTITELNDKGAVVSLGDNVEGFAPAKQLAKEDGTTAKAGETLEFKVVEFSKATKRIILSHSRLNEEIKRAEVQAERAEKKRSDDATKDSVKKLNASVEKTTLGDISGLAELKAQMEAAAEKPKKAAAKKSAKAEEASAETEE